VPTVCMGATTARMAAATAGMAAPTAAMTAAKRSCGPAHERPCQPDHATDLDYKSPRAFHLDTFTARQTIPTSHTT